MNIYADRGNLLLLQRRCEWRGIGFALTASDIGERLDPDAAYLFYIGGGQDRDQRLCGRAQVGAAAVVLEAREHLRAGAQVDLDRDVADQPRAGVADGLEVDEPDAGQALAAQLVAVAEQLVAAAHREDDASALGRGVQGVALDGGQVLRAQLLVTILTTSEVEKVVIVGIDLVAEPGAGQLEADPAPLAAALEQQQVAAVGVDVHQVRVQRADPQDAVSHAASPPPSRGGRRSPR